MGVAARCLGPKGGKPRASRILETQGGSSCLPDAHLEVGGGRRQAKEDKELPLFAGASLPRNLSTSIKVSCLQAYACI